MSRINLVSKVIGEFGQEIGMPDLALDAEDRVRLMFDETPVTFVYAAEPVELFWLYVDLGEMPANGDADKAAECLLQLGFLCWAWNKMTIGLDEAGTRAIGFTVIPVALLELGVLKEVLEHLLDAALPVRERMARREFDIDVSDLQATPAAMGPPNPATLA
jgi:hypothetical protein